ncbi:MAG: hypothetical protein J6B48_05630 [Clostridia bacterium]|nr:hypothetical protein [Clostridia bacterium]
MTDNKARRIFHSLYVKLTLVIVLGLVISCAVFVLVRFFGNYIIKTYYATDEEKTAREEEYIDELRHYVQQNKISSENTDLIAKWSKSNRYVYLLVYKNDELFFSSDMLPEKPSTDVTPEAPDPDAPDEGGEEGDGEDMPDTDGESGTENGGDNESGADDGLGGSFGSGITVDYPTREELKKYAEENDLYELEMTDGVLFASIAEFTEYLYYDVANIVSLFIAMVILSVILINYFRGIVARVKKLDQSVMAVAGGNINRSIEVKKGYDEIARLSENVENMRCTILESIDDERKARQANTELITAMSHDIRTPLTVLLGYLDIMKSEAEGDAMRSYVEASEKTAMRLKNLSDDMFNYFLAFGSAKESIHTEEYDAATLFEQMLSEHLVLIEENGYSIVLEKKDEMFVKGSTVLTDAPKLMRVMDNIFSNLMKYAEKSEPIYLRVELGPELFELEVKNTVRHDRDRQESNGIGLKTCQRLSQFVADSFEFEEKDDSFTVRLRVRLILPKETG